MIKINEVGKFKIVNVNPLFTLKKTTFVITLWMDFFRKIVLIINVIKDFFEIIKQKRAKFNRVFL